MVSSRRFLVFPSILFSKRLLSIVMVGAICTFVRPARANSTCEVASSADRLIGFMCSQEIIKTLKKGNWSTKSYTVKSDSGQKYILQQIIKNRSTVEFVRANDVVVIHSAKIDRIDMSDALKCVGDFSRKSAEDVLKARRLDSIPISDESLAAKANGLALQDTYLVQKYAANVFLSYNEPAKVEIRATCVP
jgi:hypothetical protein